MTRLLFNFVLLFLFFLFSCNSVNNDNKEQGENGLFNHLEWLTGTWTNFSGDSALYEIWKKSDDFVFSGESFMLIKADTVFSEKISIVQKTNGIFYSAKVLNQNQGKTISFKLISGEVGIFVFENKGHDFPQRIIYQQIEQDSLRVKIDGNEHGQFRAEEFLMVRMR